MNAPDKLPEKESVWQKTPYTNLLRYKPSAVYFARFRVKGKLIRRSLKTNHITVAKLHLAYLENTEQQKARSVIAVASGRMTLGDALAVFQSRVANDPTAALVLHAIIVLSASVATSFLLSGTSLKSFPGKH